MDFMWLRDLCSNTRPLDSALPVTSRVTPMLKWPNTTAQMCLVVVAGFCPDAAKALSSGTGCKAFGR